MVLGGSLVIYQVHKPAPRAQARRCGGEHPAAGASELRGAIEVVEDAYSSESW